MNASEITNEQILKAFADSPPHARVENAVDWNDFIATLGKSGLSDSEAEEAADLAFGRGILYEPMLGILKVA